MPVGLTTMDRILLAIIASAVLLLLGAASLYVTNTADLMITPARSGSPVEIDKREPLADVGERSQPSHVGLAAAQSTRLRPPGAASAITVRPSGPGPLTGARFRGNDFNSLT